MVRLSKVGLWGFLFCLLSAISAFASDLARDEELVFFPVIAHQVAKGTAWEAEIHAWVYEPERRKLELALFRKALGFEVGPTNANENALFEQRATTFLVDNERRKDLSVRIGDKVYPVGRSASNGHIVGRVRIPAEEVEKLRRPSGSASDRITFYAVLPKGDNRVFAGLIVLVEDTGVSVISDIDDTIKVTQVHDREQLLLNTFFRPFQPVEGMAAAYQSWAKSTGAKFHYISASPWQLYPSLADFILSSDFPAGTFHLKPFRWRDEAFPSLFVSTQDFKLDVIEPMMKRFPHRRFILVGDSGEKDPETYGILARRFAKQVVHIFIRDVTGQPAGAERYGKAFKNVPTATWTVFRDPKEIENVVK